MKTFDPDNNWEDKELLHHDYFLVHGSGWFHTKKFSVRIITVEDECFIEVFNKETDESLFKKEIKLTEVV